MHLNIKDITPPSDLNQNSKLTIELNMLFIMEEYVVINIFLLCQRMTPNKKLNDVIKLC